MACCNAGRLTTALFRGLSPAFKQTPLVVTPGNHDIWVAGGPGADSDRYDQFGHGFMQFYAQDSRAASGTGAAAGSGGLFNFSIVPEDPVNSELLNNAPDNFVLYHQFGNLGIIAYVGGGVEPAGILPALKEACTFMGSDDAKLVTDVLLVGHWNDPSSGCPTGSNTPSIRDVAATLPGCSQFGGRLRFADGHTHCNTVQSDPGDNSTQGFMIGGHGMSGCGQYGFMVVDTTTGGATGVAGEDGAGGAGGDVGASNGGGMRVDYYEEASDSGGDSFDAIYSCVQERGISGCDALAHRWLQPGM